MRTTRALAVLRVGRGRFRGEGRFRRFASLVRRRRSEPIFFAPVRVRLRARVRSRNPLLRRARAVSLRHRVRREREETRRAADGRSRRRRETARAYRRVRPRRGRDERREPERQRGVEPGAVRFEASSRRGGGRSHSKRLRGGVGRRHLKRRRGRRRRRRRRLRRRRRRRRRRRVEDGARNWLRLSLFAFVGGATAAARLGLPVSLPLFFAIRRLRRLRLGVARVRARRVGDGQARRGDVEVPHLLVPERVRLLREPRQHGRRNRRRRRRARRALSVRSREGGRRFRGGSDAWNRLEPRRGVCRGLLHGGEGGGADCFPVRRGGGGGGGGGGVSSRDARLDGGSGGYAGARGRRSVLFEWISVI